MTGQLEGKVAIVTGGGSGIGRAITLGFATEGATVAVADLDGSRAEAVAGEITAGGGDAIGFATDVSITKDVDAMVERTVEQFGRLDILVNNAGRVGFGWVTDMTDETWDGVFAVNVRGTFACSRAALKYMIPQRSGRILNTASGAGLRPFPRGAVYAASKAAVISLTYSLAEEVAKYGITVNAIGPGPTDTPFWRAQRPKEDIEAAYAAGQVGQPEDFVPVVVFLCSDAGGVHSGVMVNRHTYVQEDKHDPAN
jgi:NAD(P)-dependent dehydrogenase (short-subunit alcohol dehydrogenase family)